jgi:hypothetical protein
LVLNVVGGEWERYGRALIQSMSDLLVAIPEEQHALILETADFWLGLGLVIGLKRPQDAGRLVAVIETDERERLELETDAADFCARALA